MGKKKFKRKPGASLDERKKILQEARRELSKQNAENKTPKYKVQQLLEKAEECIDKFQYELAQKFCQRALETEPDNVQALETTGSLMLELGKIEDAKQCFSHAVTVSPDAGYAKYMCLGQICNGAEAVQNYKKGIDIMLKEREAQSAQELAAACGGPQEDCASTMDISNAYCSIAEIYMTDCCFDENAEQMCEESINKAIEADTENPEAYQLKASFYLSKENKKDAKEMITKSVSLWLPKYKAMDEGKMKEDQDEPLDPAEVVSLNYDTRVSTAKILTEVEEYETAVDVLEALLDENEDIPQVWYMIGWANYLQGEDYKENARFYFNECKKIYTKVKCEDEELLKHVEELLQEMGPGENLDEEENNDVNDENNCDILSDNDEEEMEH